MLRAIALLTISAVLMFAGAVWAEDLVPEAAAFFGNVQVDATNGTSTWETPQGAMLGTDVYSNVLSAPNFGFSSTSLTAQWGDRVLMTGTGLLSEHVFSIFNAGTSAGPLLTANVTVAFYDFNTSTFLGGYSTAVNFGAGLGIGFYSLVTVSALDPLLINLNVADILVIQTVTAKTGTANRLGIASLDPVTIGSSPNTMYINASTVGPAGFYNIGNPPQNANPAYRFNVMQPVPVQSTTWGAVKALYR